LSIVGLGLGLVVGLGSVLFLFFLAFFRLRYGTMIIYSLSLIIQDALVNQTINLIRKCRNQTDEQLVHGEQKHFGKRDLWTQLLQIPFSKRDRYHESTTEPAIPLNILL